MSVLGQQRVALVIAAIVVIAAAAAPLRGADSYLDDQGKIRTGKLSLHHEATKRNYYMYIPKAYDASKRWPLIVSAPGTFPFDSSPGTRDSWVGDADKYGFIILCPDFDTANGLLNVKADQEKLAKDDTVVMAIMAEVRSRYNIDPSAIAVTGWSGGGYPAHYLGLKHPDLFRAIIGRTANFSEDLVDDDTARRARHMHVFCFFAQSDLAGIPEQNRRANFWYTTHNFLNFEIKEVPGGHSKNNDLASQWFSNIVKKFPTARVEASVTSGRAPLTVDLRAIASDPDGQVVTTVWQFGDGEVSVRPTVTHTFKEAKKYNVFLTVIDNDGNREYAQIDIDVR